MPAECWCHAPKIVLIPSFNFNIEEQNTEAGDGCHMEGRVDEMEQSLKDSHDSGESVIIDCLA